MISSKKIRPLFQSKLSYSGGIPEINVRKARIRLPGIRLKSEETYNKSKQTLTSYFVIRGCIFFKSSSMMKADHGLISFVPTSTCSPPSTCSTCMWTNSRKKEMERKQGFTQAGF